MNKPWIIVPLILALLLVGAGITTVVWLSLGRGGFGSFQINPFSATADEAKQFDVSEPAELVLESDGGDVNISSGRVSQIMVTAHKTAWGSSQADARAALENVKVEMTQSGNTVTVRFKQPEGTRIFQSRPNTVSFDIIVPEQIAVQATTSFGKVDLEGTQGDADLNSSFGDIHVTDLAGGLQIKTNSGAVRAEIVSAGGADIKLSSGFGDVVLKRASAGAVTIETSSGSLTLADVRSNGRVSLTSGFGDIHFDLGSAAPLQAKTSSGRIEIAGVSVEGPVEANTSFGDIVLKQVTAGSYDVHTSSGAIAIDGAHGSVKAVTQSGDLTILRAERATLELQTSSGAVHFSGSLGAGPHTLHSDFGDVVLTIPADTGAQLDLSTDFGDIRSALALSTTLTGEQDKGHVTGTINGGGSALTASTNSGSIRIEILK